MLKGFARGFRHGLAGLAWLRRKPALLRYWVPPVVLTIGVFVLLQVLALRFFDDVLATLWAPPDAEAGWGTSALYWIAGAVSWLLAAGLALLSTFIVSVVLSSPFHDALSEATERLEGRAEPAPFDLLAVARDALRSVALELLKWAVFLAVVGPLWLLSWVIPGVGQVVYVFVSGVLAAAYFALDFTDWPASRRGWGIRRRIDWLRANAAPLLGFGACVSLLLFVPVVSLLLVPAAVIGGTRLFLELEGSA